MKSKLITIPVKTDDDGYLKNHKNWTPEIMKILAEKEGVKLEKEHLWIINFMRDYHEKFCMHPRMRTIMNQMKRQPGLKVIDCVKDFYYLFSGGLSMACRIAGLPRPG